MDMRLQGFSADAAAEKNADAISFLLTSHGVPIIMNNVHIEVDK